MLVQRPWVGEDESGLDDEDSKEEDEEDAARHRHHVDQGLQGVLHLQALQPQQVPGSKQGDRVT